MSLSQSKNKLQFNRPKLKTGKCKMWVEGFMWKKKRDITMVMYKCNPFANIIKLFLCIIFFWSTINIYCNHGMNLAIFFHNLTKYLIWVYLPTTWSFHCRSLYLVIKVLHTCLLRFFRVWPLFLKFSKNIRGGLDAKNITHRQQISAFHFFNNLTYFVVWHYVEQPIWTSFSLAHTQVSKCAINSFLSCELEIAKEAFILCMS